MMRGGRIPPDLVDEVRTVELLDTWGGYPSEWDKQDKHELDRLLAVKRAMTRWQTQEAKSASLKGRKR
jgi:hypothetical protein